MRVTNTPERAVKSCRSIIVVVPEESVVLLGQQRLLTCTKFSPVSDST